MEISFTKMEVIIGCVLPEISAHYIGHSSKKHTQLQLTIVLSGRQFIVLYNAY